MSKRANQRRAAVRVIGGRWRGRRIPLQGTTVRPTGDRVRETLFNWLTPHLTGSSCLDWFAGSGALGIEALSRGAARAVFVERDRATAMALREYLAQFDDAVAEVLHTTAETAPLQARGPFDIVFVDPPFAGPDLSNLCTLLDRSQALAPAAHVYLEMPRTDSLPALPDSWSVVRSKSAGQVSFVLAQT